MINYCFLHGCEFFTLKQNDHLTQCYKMILFYSQAKHKYISLKMYGLLSLLLLFLSSFFLHFYFLFCLFVFESGTMQVLFLSNKVKLFSNPHKRKCKRVPEVNEQQLEGKTNQILKDVQNCPQRKA